MKDRAGSLFGVPLAKVHFSLGRLWKHGCWGWSGVEVHLFMAKGPLGPIQWGWAGPSTSLVVLERRKVSYSCWVWNFPSLDSTFVFLLCDLSCWCRWPSIYIESCKLAAFKLIPSLTSLRMLHVLIGGRYIAFRCVCKVLKDYLLCHVSPSARLSTWNHFAPGGCIFLEFCIWVVLLKSVGKIQVG